MHSHVAVDGSQIPFGLGYDDGRASIGLLADFQRQRQSAQIRQAVFLGERLAAFCTKNMLGVTALAADMHRHVLDYAHYGDVQLLQHLHPFLYIQQRQILRGRDDDSCR